MNFDLDIPEQIRFGRNCRFALPEILPSGPVFFICGGHSAERIRQEILPLLGERKAVVYSGFRNEPHLEELDQVLALAGKEQAASVVGWGGGSAMDAAKAVAALVTEPLASREYFYNRAAAGKRKVFLALLPTTAGTGAEVTPNAVLTDGANGIKQSLRTPGMLPDAALVDPVLVEECPAGIMAASGFDALTQAVESFISSRAVTLTRAIARSAARDIFLNLEKACGHDPDAVDAVTAGSLNAGIAFGKSGLGAVHGLAHPLGSVLSVPHGICCAILLPSVLEYNLPAAGNLLDELAASMGVKDAGDLISRIRALRAGLGVPADFRSYGLDEKHFDFVVANCRSGSMKCNSRPVPDEEVIRILEGLK